MKRRLCAHGFWNLRCPFSLLIALCFRQIQTEAELQIFHVRYFDLLTGSLFG